MFYVSHVDALSSRLYGIRVFSLLKLIHLPIIALGDSCMNGNHSTSSYLYMTGKEYYANLVNYLEKQYRYRKSDRVNIFRVFRVFNTVY